jgi:hypothetical protein
VGDNINIYIKGIRSGVVKLIQLDQSDVQWQILVSVLMNFPVL